MQLEMEVAGLGLDPGNQGPVLFLQEKGGGRLLPIWIGVIEASAIAVELEHVKLGRPLTHDLLCAAIVGLNGKVNAVRIVGLREGTFFATIAVTHDCKTLELDARPSDAIALALRVGVPITCEGDILRQAAVPEGSQVFDQRADESEEARPQATDADIEAGRRRRASVDGPMPILGENVTDWTGVLDNLEPEAFGKYRM